MRLVMFAIAYISLLSLLSCSEETAVNNNPVYKIKIITQPQNISVFNGQFASFGVSVTGSNPTYKWYKDDEFYAEGPQVTIKANSESNGTEFYCEVSNSKGVISSEHAVLEVTEFAGKGEPRNGMYKISAENSSFVMGSVSSKALANESPIHTVSFSNSYWMDSIPVSQLSFEDTMSSKYPILFSNMPWGSSHALLPANMVSWNDAVLYCNARSRSESLDSAYSYETIIVIEKSDSITTEFRLRDSLLIRKYQDRKDDSLKCIVNGTIATITADTVKKYGVKPDTLVDTVDLEANLFDTTIHYVWHWNVGLHEIIPIAPFESYRLENLQLLSSTVSTEIKEGAKVELLDTLYKSKSDTVYVRITENGIASKGYFDTLYIDTLVDTSLVFAEGQYDTVEIIETTPIPVSGYRLPTEAEWEFAARGGSGSDYFWGDEASINTYAWSSKNSTSVNQSGLLNKPNLYGLYDMSGNVWEWCYDYYSLYSEVPQRDPIGPVVGESRVKRGGSWRDLPIYLRSSQRGNGAPDRISNGVGFRTVLTITE